MSGTISTNVFFPAISSLTQDLNATAASVSGSISLFILFQGATPVLWSGLSELVGRRIPYIASLLLYCGATAGCASANSIGVFIVLRILQACGSSAVLALGAGTLADIFDVSLTALPPQNTLTAHSVARTRRSVGNLLPRAAAGSFCRTSHRRSSHSAKLVAIDVLLPPRRAST